MIKIGSHGPGWLIQLAKLACPFQHNGARYSHIYRNNALNYRVRGHSYATEDVHDASLVACRKPDSVGVTLGTQRSEQGRVLIELFPAMSRA